MPLAQVQFARRNPGRLGATRSLIVGALGGIFGLALLSLMVWQAVGRWRPDDQNEGPMNFGKMASPGVGPDSAEVELDSMDASLELSPDDLLMPGDEDETFGTALERDNKPIQLSFDDRAAVSVAIFSCPDVLSGTWQVFACERNGKSVKRFVGTRYTFGTVKMKTSDPNLMEETEDDYDCSTHKDPYQLDISVSNKSPLAKLLLPSSMKGIFSIQGNSMRWCRGDISRPKSFQAKENDGNTLLFLRKISEE